ncbi:MAG TPA: hypothetical protein VEL05_06490, partial [Candidatus Acidoferrum sp.]|nr:hypothetical protein [Candidatus Acidoferrum sp.]
LTVQGGQTDPSDPARFLVLCLPRPDRIGSDAIPLDDTERVELIDLTATDTDGCRLELDRDRPLAGDITFSGFCQDGTHPDGYALSFAATVPLLRACPVDAGPVVEDPVDGHLGGRAAVAVSSAR